MTISFPQQLTTRQTDKFLRDLELNKKKSIENKIYL